MKRARKVLFAHDHIFIKTGQEYYSNGGLPYSSLARYLHLGDKVTVLARVSTNAQSIVGLTRASGSGVSFTSIPNFRSLGGIHRVLSAVRIVHAEVKTTDVIVARLPSSIGTLTQILGLVYRKPTIVEVVGCARDANREHGATSGKLIAPFAFRLMRTMVRKSTHTIYITREFLQSRYPPAPMAQVAICPNVELPPLDRRICDRRFRSKNQEPARVTIGLIGSLDVDYKGHETLIRALAILEKNEVLARVEFLGSGDPSRWQDLAAILGVSHLLEFVGTLRKSEVFDWLDKIDLQVQPSSAEAQGRAIIEGMSRACPIISTEVGGIPELIGKEWLVTPHDFECLSEKIAEMIRDRSKMAAAGCTNFSNVEDYQRKTIEKRRRLFFDEFERTSINHGGIKK